MKRVAVIGTEHQQRGLIKVSSLLSILERIRPEVVYLESPPAVFDDYLTMRRTLEATAAATYRTIHRVELVPVDLPTPEEEFFRNSRQLFETVERRNSEYCRLVDQHRYRAATYGFAYLNSAYCGQYFDELHEAMRATIAKLDDYRVAKWYESWVNIHGMRDLGMMANIEKHSEQSSFGTAAFLVGVAHRHSMITVPQAQSRGGPTPITWDFVELLEGPLGSKETCC